MVLMIVYSLFLATGLLGLVLIGLDYKYKQIRYAYARLAEIRRGGRHVRRR